MPFPEVLDSSMINTWRDCNQKFFNNHCENLTLPGLDVNLHFGGCFARAIEVTRKAYFNEGMSAADAIVKGSSAGIRQWGDYVSPTKSRKTWKTLLLLLDGYWKQWPLETDVLRPANVENAIEFSFAIPIPGLKHPDNGGDLVYAGRFDMLGEISPLMYVVDEKTTGQVFPYNWAQGWNLRSQFLGYIWACQLYGYPVHSCLVRGACVHVEMHYAQAIVQATDHLLERWYVQMTTDAHRMVDQYLRRHFDYALNDTCKDYGGCIYVPLCEAKQREDWTSLYSVKEPWNPLRRPGGEP